MPTPFVHLSFTSEVLAMARGLSLADDCHGHLLVGSIAPDESAISDVHRQDTHFFRLGAPDEPPSPQTLLHHHPQLADPRRLPPATAAFLAGYLAHLLVDDLWIHGIFRPHFGRHAAHDSFEDRLLLHNVLRTFLDQEERARLGDSVWAALRNVPIHYDLPFVDDPILRDWRDLVCDQLAPGAQTRTVEIFANRTGVSTAEVEAILHSPQVMEERVFSRVPRDRLAHFRQEAVESSAELIARYASGELGAAR